MSSPRGRRPPRDTERSPHGQLTIAEDDDDIRDTLTLLFIQDGFEVTQVANGELLAQHLEKRFRASRLPDMLIMDHRMPGYSGLDILRALRQRGWEIPVIMITAFGKEVYSTARSLGACAVFEKPFDHDDLRTAVFFYLEAMRCPTPLASRSADLCTEDGDLELIFSDSWEAFEVWIRQTIGGDFTWLGSPRDSPECRQIIIDSIRVAMALGSGMFPLQNAFLARRGTS